jgi:hypothetical protein
MLKLPNAQWPAMAHTYNILIFYANFRRDHRTMDVFLVKYISIIAIKCTYMYMCAINLRFEAYFQEKNFIVVINNIFIITH